AATAATLPWNSDPPRSNTTRPTPAARARSATSRPTVPAASLLPVAPARSSFSWVDAAASVRPVLSSMTWATTCLFDRNTASRGRHVEGDAGRSVDRDGVAEAEGELDLARAVRGRPVAHADDLEVLREPGRHPDHHVVDERPGQAVQGPVVPLVVGPLHAER